MKVMLSKHALMKIEVLSIQEKEKLKSFVTELKNNRFPRISALLKGDKALAEGTFSRLYKDLRIIYKFMEPNAIVIVAVFNVKDSRSEENF